MSQGKETNDRAIEAGEDAAIGARRARKGMAILACALTLVVAVVVAGLYLAANRQPAPSGFQPAIPAQSVSPTDVAVPLADVSATASFYSYNSSGTTVRFFVVRGSDGQVHAATDACDVCYPAKKGYQQTGEVMTCNNCGKTFAINRLGSENTAGGCWPSHLPMRIEGNNVLVSKADLDAKITMFQ
jgi:uncharacterized membrane protein